tara:strand:+ start:232 stop:495 length:264 start_codon:yes stop_codon:yes gene_type:complete
MLTKEEVLQQIYFNNCFEQLSKSMMSLMKANPNNRKLKELSSKLREMFFHFNSVHVNNKLLKSELNRTSLELKKTQLKLREYEQRKT